MKKTVKTFLMALTTNMLLISSFCNCALAVNDKTTELTADEISISDERLSKAVDEYNNALNSISEKSDTIQKIGQVRGPIIPEGEFDYKVLNFPSNPQINGYYCGPASAYNLLCGMGKGSNVTQQKLGTSLGTTTPDNTNSDNTNSFGTDFGSNWSKTLATYAGGTWSVTWASSSNWSQRLSSALYSNLKNNKGIICDTHQTANTPKLSANYNSATNTWHYIACDGMDLKTSRIHFVDSNRSCAGSYWTSYNTMSAVTKDRGIVW